VRRNRNHYLFATHPHFFQYRFHLFLSYQVVFPKYFTETPVWPLHHVIFYLLHECPLDLFKGYILSRNGDTPEAVDSPVWV